MKTNKKFLLTLALATACCAQPTHSMNYVHFGLSKAQEHWKPLATAFAVIGVSYWLWANYNQKTTQPILDEKKELDQPLNLGSYTIKIKDLEKNGPLLILQELEQLAQQVGATEDLKKRAALYGNADKLFERTSPEVRQALLMYKEQQLNVDSKDKNNVLHYLRANIEKWYKKEKIDTGVFYNDSTKFCLSKINEIKALAKQLDETEDPRQMRLLYEAADNFFESTHPHCVKKVLLFNNKYLLTNSQSNTCTLRHLNTRITQWYKSNKLL